MITASIKYDGKEYGPFKFPEAPSPGDLIRVHSFSDHDFVEVFRNIWHPVENTAILEIECVKP